MTLPYRRTTGGHTVSPSRHVQPGWQFQSNAQSHSLPGSGKSH